MHHVDRLVWSGLVLSETVRQIQDSPDTAVSPTAGLLVLAERTCTAVPFGFGRKTLFSRRSVLAPSSGADCLLYCDNVTNRGPRTQNGTITLVTADRPNLRLGHVLFNPCTLAPPRYCARPDLPIYHGWLSFIAHTGTVGALLCDMASSDHVVSKSSYYSYYFSRPSAATSSS